MWLPRTGRALRPANGHVLADALADPAAAGLYGVRLQAGAESHTRTLTRLP